MYLKSLLDVLFIFFEAIFDVLFSAFDVLGMLTGTSNKVILYTENMFLQNLEGIAKLYR